MKGESAGTALVIFGALHGNEPAGPLAMERIASRMTSGEIPLIHGELTMVPVANPGAYAGKERYLEQDLNRVFRRTHQPGSYEAALANELAPLIEGSDVFLDIHSTAAPGPTSVFIDFPTEENTRFAEALGMEYALIGWPALYANNPYGYDSYDTTRFAFENGKTGIIIECGQHTEPDTQRVAEESILRSLAHFSMIPADFAPQPRSNQTKRVRMVLLEYKQNGKDSFTKEWKHLEPIPAGTIIAKRATGQEIRAEADSLMLLPKLTAKAGQEWFYLGVEEMGS